MRNWKNRLTGYPVVSNSKALEGDVLFSMEFSVHGHAVVSGILKPEGSAKGTITFKLETDQSSPSDTVQQLGAVLRKLPVRGVA